MRKITCIFLLLVVSAVWGQRGEDNLTVAQRRQAWLSSVPGPSAGMTNHERRMYFSAWLKKGIWNSIVQETLDNYLDPDKNAGGYWNTGGRSHHGYLLTLAYRYGTQYGNGAMPASAENQILNKVRKNISKSYVYGNWNPNKHPWSLGGTLLYTILYEDDSIQFPVYGHKEGTAPTDLDAQNWPTFSYGGNTYTFDSGPYNGQSLSRDLVLYSMESYLGTNSDRFKSNREFDSLNYHRAYPCGLIMLWEFLPDNATWGGMKEQCRMAAELMLLDAIMDYGGSEWGSSLGRTDFKNLDRPSVFPYWHWFGKGDVDPFGRPDLYYLLVTSDYAPPNLLIDLAVLTDEPDEYWHWHTEYHNSTLKHDDATGKWNYVTPYYNLGSNVSAGNNGWQATIRGDNPGRGQLIRFWINDFAGEPDPKRETRNIGKRGRQYRNAMFVNIGSTPYYHEEVVGTSWSMEETDGGWKFKRYGNVFLALQFGNREASVEFALQGVDYSSWNTFKVAIKTNAQLTNASYRTSKGVTITEDDHCGKDSPGDCSFPFKRMETWHYTDGKVLSWSGDNKLTVNYGGRRIVYDFSDWTRSGDTGENQLPVAITKRYVINVNK